jgi:hypothetical protein
MNVKSLALGLAVSASLGITAKATELVTNGDLEGSTYPSGTVSEDIINTPGQITDWTVSGYGSTSNSWNAIYVLDNFSTSPYLMPAAYRSCTAALGFQRGASCSNPNGTGYFVNLDGDSAFPAAISQTIPIGGTTGLQKKQEYQLTFSWGCRPT